MFYYNISHSYESKLWYIYDVIKNDSIILVIRLNVHNLFNISIYDLTYYNKIKLLYYLNSKY